MHETGQISYSLNNGYLTLVLRPFYATAGAYEIWITDGEQLLKIGKGNFSDGIDDVYVIPVEPNELPNWQLIIVGSYASAYGHDQIAVDYTFYQQATPLKVQTQIRENRISLATQHDFVFIPI